MSRLRHILCAFSVLALVSCSGDREPARFVNVWNGTAFVGNTYPGATVPFGAVQLSPDTDAGLASGYHYSHTSILGFSHTHLSGTGCPDLGDFLVTPGLDSLTALPFSHRDETAFPGYYKVRFPERGMTAELTATPRTGVHRYTFTGKGRRLIRVDANHCQGGWCTPYDIRLSLADGELSASRRVTGWAHGRDVYLSAVFSVPYESAEETAPGVVLFTFPADTKEVTLYAGISGVSVGGARNNRTAETEGLSFDGACARARALWNDALGTIEVKGGPADVFYTNFYHTFLTPNRIDDADGAYRDEAGRNRQLEAGRPFYSTLSIWDTFRSWNPLQTLLNPTLVEDIVRSMLDDYDCRGELPVWPLASDETGCMNGYHSVSVIADAWLHGIRGFDGEKALRAMMASSDRNNADASLLYNGFGYIPADLMAESVSQTLEFAYDDWCIARMAESLGHADIAAQYDARSLRYRTLFDPETGFLRGRKSDGNWTEPFDPLSGSHDYTEATPWHYRFFVPHDMAGFAALMGGKEALYGALDSLFTYTPAGQKTLDEGIGGLLGQYAHGNEPSHHMAFLFNWVGAPARTQEVVRTILTTMYTTAPDGLCGNEDCGQMGAWYVLAALGLSPACPGTGEFQLTAPLFAEAKVRLGNGNTLTIRADHPEYAYIEAVTLNGEPVRQHFLTYEQVMGGGELSFRLSREPAHGRDDLPAPYSLTRTAFASPPAVRGLSSPDSEETTLSMTSRTEGAVIRYTLDGSEPTPESPLYTAPVPVSASCPVRARAFREGMDPSPEVSRMAHRQLYQPSADRSGLRRGCRYTFHTANFRRLDQIEGDPPEAVGVMRAPTLADAAAEDHFAYRFTGYVDIPQDGRWTFRLRSDDGSALYLYGTCVVESGGAGASAEGQIPLKKGLHPYKLLYFEEEGGQQLSWEWKAPGATDFSPVPEGRLYYR